MNPADAVNAGLPRHQAQQQKNAEQGPGDAFAAGFDICFSAVPHAQLGPHWPADEPHQLDHHQKNAEELEEEVIHQQRNTEKQRQAIEPGPQRKGDQKSVAFAGRAFAVRLIETQQGAPQPGAGEGAAALVQIRKIKQVGEDEIAVEAHEGAEVEQHRQYPAGGRQEKQRVFQRAIRCQAPGQRGQPGNGQLGDDAGAGNRQALTRVGQLPAFAGVGVEHGKHHQHGDAHVRHAHAVARGGDCMPDFMQCFGKNKRHGVAQKTG